MLIDADPAIQLPGKPVAQANANCLTRAYGSWMSFTSLDTARREVYAFARACDRLADFCSNEDLSSSSWRRAACVC